jgi:muconolactone D-isomerase
MKFLVVAKMREAPSVPMEKIRAMVVGEWQTALQIRKEGKVDVGYALVGQKGGVSIHEAESGADLNAQLMRLPMYVFLDIDIYPLMTIEEALKQAKEGLSAFRMLDQKRRLPFKNGVRRSMGTGKIVVEFFSVAISDMFSSRPQISMRPSWTRCFSRATWAAGRRFGGRGGAIARVGAMCGSRRSRRRAAAPG